MTSLIPTRRDWYFGVSVVVISVALHAACPRYEWRNEKFHVLRIDRWTGQTTLGVVSPAYGRWVALREMNRDAAAYSAAQAAEAARRSSGAPGANQRIGVDVHLRPNWCPPLPAPTDTSPLAEADRILYAHCQTTRETPTR